MPIIGTVGFPAIPVSETTEKVLSMTGPMEVVGEVGSRHIVFPRPYDAYQQAHDRLFILKSTGYSMDLLHFETISNSMRAYRNSSFRPSFTLKCMDRHSFRHVLLFDEADFNYCEKATAAWKIINRTVPNFHIDHVKAAEQARDEYIITKSTDSGWELNQPMSKLDRLIHQDDDKRRKRYGNDKFKHR